MHPFPYAGTTSTVGTKGTLTDGFKVPRDLMLAARSLQRRSSGHCQSGTTACIMHSAKRRTATAREPPQLYTMPPCISGSGDMCLPLTASTHRSMTGVGRGAGEPPEAAWSYLGAFGTLIQYNSLPARQAALERIAANLNDRKHAGLPQLLQRMYERAAREKFAAELNARTLVTHATSSAVGVTEDQVCRFSLLAVPALAFRLEICCSADMCTTLSYPSHNRKGACS